MFRVAMAIGCTVGELSERMTSAEWTGWVAYFAVEPFGPVVDDVRFHDLTAAVYQSQGVKVDPDTFRHIVDSPRVSTVDTHERRERMIEYMSGLCPALR
jgi:hypothetical protein